MSDKSELKSVPKLNSTNLPIGLIQVWIHNYRGQAIYKTVMPIAPREGDVISDGPDNLNVTRVQWFEYTERHDWVAEVYTCKADHD
jgi:hypothetical protein